MENILNSTIKNGRKNLLILYGMITYVFAGVFTLLNYALAHDVTLLMLVINFAVSVVALIFFRIITGVSKQVWRYGGIQCYIRLIISDFLAMFSYIAIIHTIRLVLIVSGSNAIIDFPFIYMLSFMMANLLFTLIIRMGYRFAYKCGNRQDWVGKVLRFLLKVFGAGRVVVNPITNSNAIRVAILGAGSVGIFLSEELLTNPLTNYVPVCFIDIAKAKVGNLIHEIPVINDDEYLMDELKNRNVQEVIIAVPLLSSDKKRELYERFKNAGYKVKVYDTPRIDSADGKRILREFEVEELLFRQQIKVNNEKTYAFYKNKVVLVTGAGGSIGSVLARQIAHMEPKKLVLLDVYENSVYDLEQHLIRRHGDKLNFNVEVLSIVDKEALEKVFEKYKPQIVLHAAAHKHVPLMEHNCVEAVTNNVFGTLNVVEASEKYGVERMMMVSTDKAVNPTNVMGATKRMCELIVQTHSATSKTTTFSATRFGNVLGSNGSVIPLFKRQIANGGPITITDKRIIRYFMTIPEATQLILESASRANNGELFVLDMGKPVKILDLAENMIRLSGFVPYKDIDIVEVGLRPGEKLYEELLVKGENLSKTDNELIFIEKDAPLKEEELNRRLSLLRDAIKVGDNDNMREVLKQCVPTFKSNKEVNNKAEEAEEMKSAKKIN